jgi:hypothetical protein
MATSTFGFPPGTPSRGRISSRNNGVANHHDPAHDPNVEAIPAHRQMRANPNSSERSELCREHRRTRIYIGELLLPSGNRSNIPAVIS